MSMPETDFDNPQPSQHSSASTGPTFPSGKVFLVHVGPGDPGLITARAIRCLQTADVVVVDGFAHWLLLRELKEGAQVFRVVDKQGDQANATTDSIGLGCLLTADSRPLTRSEVPALIVTAAQQGSNVTYLFSSTLGCASEHEDILAVLRKAQVAYEIVPGIPQWVAAMAQAEITPAGPGKPRAVLFVDASSPKSHRDFVHVRNILQRFPDAIFVVASPEEIPQRAAELIRVGLAPFTKSVVISRAGMPDQESWEASLGQIVNKEGIGNVGAPALVIVGDQVRLEVVPPRWMSRPLRGQRILVTRPEDQAYEFAEKLVELGAEVLVQPAITISDPPDWQPVDEAIERLADFAWVVFTSTNGVRFFLRRLLTKGGDLRKLGGVRIAAIGPGTAETLSRYFLKPDLVPPEYRAESLAEALLQKLGPAPSNCRVLLVRASRGRPVLAEMLQTAGVPVCQVVAYTSADVTTPLPEVAGALSAGEIDWITVTSSSIARSLVHMFGENLRKAKLASISPVTSGTLRELGFEPTVEAEVYTLSGLVEAIVRYLVR